MQIRSVDPSTSFHYKGIYQHRELSPFFAYSVGLVHTQLEEFQKISVENKVYFAFVLRHLHLKCFHPAKVTSATHLFTQNILLT